MTETERRTIGAKIELFNDGSATAAVYLMPGEIFVALENHPSRDAAETFVRSKATELAILAAGIEFRYTDRRTTVPKRRPFNSRPN